MSGRWGDQDGSAPLLIDGSDAGAYDFRRGPYRVYFVSHDCREPAHVHVDRDIATVKFWLQPFRLASQIGFSRHELRDIERMVGDTRERCLEVWHEHCGRASD